MTFRVKSFVPLSSYHIVSGTKDLTLQDSAGFWTINRLTRDVGELEKLYEKIKGA